MTRSDAQETALRAVYVPLLFEKVAAVSGFRPQSEEESQIILDMARQAEIKLMARKSAGVRPELIKAAGNMGLVEDRAGQASKQAMSNVLADPALLDVFALLGTAA